MNRNQLETATAKLRLSMKSPADKLVLSYMESLLESKSLPSDVSAKWCEVVIVLGGVLAYFFDPAWLALSALALSTMLNAGELHYRASFVAVIEALATLSRQIDNKFPDS